MSRSVIRWLGAILAGWPGAVAASDLLAPVPAHSAPADVVVSAADLWRQVEEDWLRQARAWQARRRGECGRPGQGVSTQGDAAGGCDGVKNGKYAFHTGLEANPWWQVDLGEPRAVARIVVYNRLDYAPGLHNADRVRILTSLDGRTWLRGYDNPGRHFGGVHGAPPLEVRFAPEPVRARYVRLQLPGAHPVFFHLDEVEVYGPDADGVNLALHRPADQSSVSPWSVAKPRPEAGEARYPVLETIGRGRQLARDLAGAGADVGGFARELDALERRAAALFEAGPAGGARALYVEVRRVIRRLAMANPLLDFDRVLLVNRFTQETYPDICLNHMPWVSRPGGDLCVLAAGRGDQTLFEALAGAGDAAAGAGGAAGVLGVRHVLNGALGPGHVHGMDLEWGGERVVFGYARARSSEPPEGWLDRTRSYELRRREEPIHLFEVGVDGRGLRQLTDGVWSDLDPTWLPDGGIAFVSERCGTSLQCNEFDKDETSCNLYAIDARGGKLRRLSVSKDGDYLPHCLDNGWIVYTRWEYHERSWAYLQSLWTIRPDGTGADALFKQHLVDPWALEDARSISGSGKLVAVAAGHHTLAAGPVVVVDPTRGINNPDGLGIVTPGVFPPEGGMAGVPVPEGGVEDCGGFYATPWALSEKYFLVSYTHGKERDPAGYALYLIDVFGNKELLYRDPAISTFCPIPLRARARPPVIADTTVAGDRHAVCLLADAGFGVEGVERSRIRHLRLAEPVGWPYDPEHGGQRYGEDHRYAGPAADRRNLVNWTPVRILGDVPVDADGSAHFQVPADTAVYFQLLDERRMELRRMRSFLSFQPGERRACVGCHESRAAAPPPGKPALAGQRAPSVPVPPPWGDRAVSFLRDVQPVLDRHCVRCHRGLTPAGGLDFSGGLTSHDAEVAGYGYNRAFETMLEHGLVALSKVRAQDASVTPALAYGAHRSRLVAALDKEPHAQEVRLTEEDRLRLVMWIDANAPYHDGFVNKRAPRRPYDVASDRELLKRLTARHDARCGSCHAAAAVTRLDWIDLRRPRRSLFLMAPLAREAGGLGACRPTVYAEAADPDYQAVFTEVLEAVRRAAAFPRRDLRSWEAGVTR
ncbi:MAG: discoidin domain-containing protein [Verrucomicrobia bacterium]|nr:discoidin domain-containing protein [Verrucomicrobiota bacterium]